MKETPIFEFPFPEATDPPDGAKQIEEAVEAVEQLLSTIELLVGSVSTPATPEPGQLIVVNGTSDPRYIAATGDLTINSAGVATIANLAVTAAKLAEEAVSTAKLLNLNVTEGKLAALAVTAAKIGSEAVETGKIKASAVTGAKIAAKAITESHLSDALREAMPVGLANSYNSGLKAIEILPAPSTLVTVIESGEGTNIKGITVNNNARFCMYLCRVACTFKHGEGTEAQQLHLKNGEAFAATNLDMIGFMWFGKWHECFRSANN